jgi:hypothetical protein
MYFLDLLFFASQIYALFDCRPSHRVRSGTGRSSRTPPDRSSNHSPSSKPLCYPSALCLECPWQTRTDACWFRAGNKSLNPPILALTTIKHSTSILTRPEIAN